MTTKADRARAMKRANPSMTAQAIGDAVGLDPSDVRRALRRRAQRALPRHMPQPGQLWRERYPRFDYERLPLRVLEVGERVLCEREDGRRCDVRLQRFVARYELVQEQEARAS